MTALNELRNSLQLETPDSLVVTVAGTNGKGSCVATMEAILQQAGYKTGCYTSPHIHAFNERIRIDSKSIDDESLVAALEAIDGAREGESLSYFEYATLAGLYLFRESQVDICLLEVGLGGRLDAVNIVDADVAIISSIGIDHTDWLGNDIESIAAEKAGIMRCAFAYGLRRNESSVRDYQQSAGVGVTPAGARSGFSISMRVPMGLAGNGAA